MIFRGSAQHAISIAVVALLIALLSLAPGNARAQDIRVLEGAWERIAVRVVLPDTTIEERFDTDARLRKILTSGYFAFGQESADGTDVFAGGGTFEYTGDSYIETYDYHESPSMVGKTIVFESRLEGGLWYISGIVGRFRLEETWRRLP